MNTLSLRSRPLTVLAAGILLIAVASVAHAQTRTWVSGVGDDANPCSRTAPCKTFAAAISRTAAGGEINVLDPAGFGGVTITKSITISSEGLEAGVLVSGTNGIVINAGANDTIVLRGLDIEGLGTGLSGITMLAGGTLHVEKCTINNFVNQGIDISAANANVSVKDTIIRDNSNQAGLGGLRLHGGANTVATVDRTRFEGNTIGVRVESGKAVIHDGTIYKSTNGGITVAGGEVDADNVLLDFNGAGANVVSGTFKTVNSSYWNNTNNISGAFTSLGGNHSDGSGTGPAAGTF